MVHPLRWAKGKAATASSNSSSSEEDEDDVCSSESDQDSDGGGGYTGKGRRLREGRCKVPGRGASKQAGARGGPSQLPTTLLSEFNGSIEVRIQLLHTDQERWGPTKAR